MSTNDTVKSDILERINKFNAECDKKRSAIVEDLTAELDRLKAELRIAAKHYKDFTGKEVKFSLGSTGVTSNGSEVNGKVIDLVMAHFADGKEHNATEAATKLAAQHGGEMMNYRPTIYNLAKTGKLAKGNAKASFKKA